MMSKKYNNTNKKRLLYGISFLALLVIEIIIALYVHDSFIRPYLGDVLVVIVLYTGVRMLKPEGITLLPLYLFLFALMVELLQFFQIIQLLHMENNRFLRVLVGSVFDIKDIICYGVGCMILGFYEWRKTKL